MLARAYALLRGIRLRKDTPASTYCEITEMKLRIYEILLITIWNNLLCFTNKTDRVELQYLKVVSGNTSFTLFGNLLGRFRFIIKSIKCLQLFGGGER